MSALVKILLKYQTSEEKQVAQLLFDDTVDVVLGDQRLNILAAHTYNAGMCEKIFVMLEKAVSPAENAWKTLLKAILILHTIVLYGSELAVDKAIDMCRFIHPLQEYNSALVRRGSFFGGGGGGTDYGQPVRTAAKALVPILMTDESIRQARHQARGGEEILVPVGETYPASGAQSAAAQQQPLTFGQGLTSRVGAGFGMEAVPGMYEGRPERYFDNQNDIRARPTQTGDHQFTREVNIIYILFVYFGCFFSSLPLFLRRSIFVSLTGVNLLWIYFFECTG